VFISICLSAFFFSFWMLPACDAQVDGLDLSMNHLHPFHRRTQWSEWVSVNGSNFLRAGTEISLWNCPGRCVLRLLYCASNVRLRLWFLDFFKKALRRDANFWFPGNWRDSRVIERSNFEV
jgi:hypothetical protein